MLKNTEIRQAEESPKGECGLCGGPYPEQENVGDVHKECADRESAWQDARESVS